jgi:hypothetical protein
MADYRYLNNLISAAQHRIAGGGQVFGFGMAVPGDAICPDFICQSAFARGFLSSETIALLAFQDHRNLPGWPEFSDGPADAPY